MTLLITGGAGYIGSHAALGALRRGQRVLIVDNLSRGRADIVDRLRSLPGAETLLSFVQADLLDTAALVVAMRQHGVTRAMHFAALAYVGESVHVPLMYYSNNVQGSVSLLEACAASGVRSLVFSSTCATFGVPERLPIVETTPQLPINPYGASKLMVERVLRDYAHAAQAKAGGAGGVTGAGGAQRPFRFAALRYFNVAGCESSGLLGEQHSPETHLIPVILQCLLGQRPQDQNTLTVFGKDYPTPDGTCVRDYIHVVDLVDAHFAALDKLEVLHETAGSPLELTYNLGIGHGFSVRQVIASAERVTGRKLNVAFGPRREGDPPELTADPSKARRELGWAAKFTELDAIVDSAWQWFKRQGA